MNARARIALLLPALAISLIGCATNALRIEYASDVAAKGKVAAAASRDFLVKVDATRVAANIDLIAVDPACVPNTAYVRRQPLLVRFKNPDKPPRGWLCAPQAIAGVTYDDSFSLAPLGGDLEPTFVLIDALGAYSAAITAILDDKGPDPVKDLTDALGLARSADGLLHALAGGTAIVPAADDPRLSAVGKFIQFVSDLRTEQDKAKRLKLLTDSPEGSADIVRALRRHLAVWELSRKADEGLRFALSGILIAKAQAAEPPLRMAQRRDFARSYYDRAAAVVTSAKLKPALDAVLTEVGDADADLRRVIVEHPKLNETERRKLAQITRERVGRAFDTLTQLVLAFKGV